MPRRTDVTITERQWTAEEAAECTVIGGRWAQQGTSMCRVCVDGHGRVDSFQVDLAIKIDEQYRRQRKAN
jgi:hypothetical protein